jgi:nucleoredoxin
MESLVQGELQTKQGTFEPTSTLLAQKKVIGLYFSGHYCPPCRKFTPLLAEVYEEIKEENDDFEIIFVSSDKEEDSFIKYYSEMPWLALPYAKRDLKVELCGKFGVQTIPTLIFFNEKGEMIEREGRNYVEKNAHDSAALLEGLHK